MKTHRFFFAFVIQLVLTPARPDNVANVPSYANVMGCVGHPGAGHAGTLRLFRVTIEKY